MSDYATMLFEDGVSRTITWQDVRRWTRKKYNELRESGYYSGHNSHAASKAIELAGEHFDLGHGAEGFCDGYGNYGYTYLNMGDTYDTTILFSSEDERFVVGCYGDIIENAPEDRYL